jgi:peptidoglycan/xylan/chitin deacetylase (PgdA/CDA1 family)
MVKCSPVLRETLLPGPARRWLYDHHPLRERRWARYPGLRTLDRPVVALTFDDGPDPAGTPPVLRALGEAGVPATFFMLGEHARAHPGLTAEVIAAGHEVALHGDTHRRADRLDPGEAREDVLRGAATLRELGCDLRFYRPPFGRSSEGTLEGVARAGLQQIYWSAWGFDWERRATPAGIARRVAEDLEPGAVVLLHDTAQAAAAVGPIVERARAAGLAFDRLSA